MTVLDWIQQTRLEAGREREGERSGRQTCKGCHVRTIIHAAADSGGDGGGSSSSSSTGGMRCWGLTVRKVDLPDPFDPSRPYLLP